MIYKMKNCRDGSAAPYYTTVDITEKNNIVTFAFRADHSEFYCPYSGYNKLHCDGDICEVLIGSDPNRKTYYEIEINPNNEIMLAKMTFGGLDESGKPILSAEYVEKSFLKTAVTRTADGYTATVTFNKNDVMTGEGELYFNAYRIETDGGEMDKHLIALIPTMRPKFHAPEYFGYLKDYAEKM